MIELAEPRIGREGSPTCAPALAEDIDWAGPRQVSLLLHQAHHKARCRPRSRAGCDTREWQRRSSSFDVPDRPIANLPDRRRGEFVLRSRQLLWAHHSGCASADQRKSTGETMERARHREQFRKCRLRGEWSGHNRATILPLSRGVARLPCPTPASLSSIPVTSTLRWCSKRCIRGCRRSCGFTRPSALT